MMNPLGINFPHTLLPKRPQNPLFWKTELLGLYCKLKKSVKKRLNLSFGSLFLGTSLVCTRLFVLEDVNVNVQELFRTFSCSLKI